MFFSAGRSCGAARYDEGKEVELLGRQLSVDLADDDGLLEQPKNSKPARGPTILGGVRTFLSLAAFTPVLSSHFSS